MIRQLLFFFKNIRAKATITDGRFLTLVEWLKQQQEQQPTKNKKNKTKVITADLADSPPEPDNIPIASQDTRFYSN